MTEVFDAVIVGSGFGGSVMAYRLADAGMSVCVLERGKPYPPGSFPRSPHAMGRNFWDPSEGLLGMFDIWSFRDSEAVVSSGLGGGSLIYANVLIRKPESWFLDKNPGTGQETPWPVTRAELDPHYDRVEKILNGQPYPLDTPPFNQTPKTLALQWAADQLGLQWYLPKLAITFANAGQTPATGQLILEQYPNLHGAQRSTCRLCGECDVGCNFGSKNTLDYNYLSLAKLKKADIRALHEVRSFRPMSGGGYEVDYVIHDPANEGAKTATDRLPVKTIIGKRLILSAGTLGTTYLLLKNRVSFPRISARLGDRFSTNGDLLTFAARCTLEAKDGTRLPKTLDPSYGPVITSTIHDDGAARGDPTTGFYLQDAGYPQFINWLVEASDAPGHIQRFAHFLWHRFINWITNEPYDEIGGEVAELLGPCDLSNGTMPLLGMGRDLPDGKMGLRRAGDGKDYLDVDWRGIRSAKYFDWVTDTSRKVADKLGADFIQNPDTQYLHRLVTVHPLGGCSMGNTEEDGVVDAFGQVFNYTGLYVADGSVMPGPTGSNPSLTIAALADRFADQIIASAKPARTGAL